MRLRCVDPLHTPIVHEVNSHRATTKRRAMVGSCVRHGWERSCCSSATSAMRSRCADAYRGSKVEVHAEASHAWLSEGSVYRKKGTVGGQYSMKMIGDSKTRALSTRKSCSNKRRAGGTCKRRAHNTHAPKSSYTHTCRPKYPWRRVSASPSQSTAAAAGKSTLRPCRVHMLVDTGALYRSIAYSFRRNWR